MSGAIAQETERNAIAAIVFAVLGWTGLPLLGPILALVYARRARERIQTSNGRVRGLELAEAAQSIARAWFWFLLVVLLLVFFALVAAVALRPRRI